jgi:putative methionine-R-sulfoxide reductase with GAF domain
MPKQTETTTGEIITFKAKGDYSEFIIEKNVDGEIIEVVDIDAMTEEQFKKYCRDEGAEWFQRLSTTVEL